MRTAATVEPKPALQPRRRRLPDGVYTQQLARLGKAREFLNQLPGYLPASWCAHVLGLARSAIPAAIRKGRVRREVLIAPDGFELELVAIQDVARIGRRRGEPGAVPPYRPRRGRGVRREGSGARTRQTGSKRPRRGS
jgi:hypothetical protein